MKKNYLVGGVTALAFFYVVGYDYYTGNISVFAKKVIENGTTEIADVSGLSDSGETDVTTDADVADASGDISDASDSSGDVSDASGDVSDVSGDVTDVSGDVSDTSGDVSDAAGDLTDVSADMMADMMADLSDLASLADPGDLLADADLAGIADPGDLLADSDLGGIADPGDLLGGDLSGLDIGGLLADSDLLGGLGGLLADSDLLGGLGGTALGGNNGGDLGGNGTGIEEDFAAGKVGIYNFPNPTDGLTHFRFQLNEGAQVRIVLYGSNGQMVGNVLNKQFGPGEFIHTYNVNGLVPGTYVYSYQVGNRQPVIRRMMVK